MFATCRSSDYIDYLCIRFNKSDAVRQWNEIALIKVENDVSGNNDLRLAE